MKKRLEEVKLEQQHQEALLRHHEMVLEDKRKQQEAKKYRDDSMLKERSKLIHDLKRVTEVHDDLQVKYTNMKQDLEVTNCAKVKLESTVDALSIRILSESVITNDEGKIHYYTGLPSCTVLQGAFNITAKGLPTDDTQACMLFEQFLITLMNCS